MGAAEICTIILSALAAIVSLSTLIVVLKKKNGGGASNNIDELTELANDVRSMLDESADKRRDDVVSTIHNDKELILQSNKAVVEGIVVSINGYIKSSEERMTQLSDKLERNIQEMKREQSENNKAASEKMAKLVTDTTESIRQTLEKLSEKIRAEYESTRKAMKDGVDEMRGDLEKNLAGVREDNNKQLEKMRETVDEKLSKTLEERLTKSFDVVRGELESVNKNLGEMQKLGENVKDINKVFIGVKTRGNWGETALAALLEDLLDKSQYVEQFQIRGQNRVDFAVKMPGRDGGEVYLPIDSKFPTENFTKLTEATANGDPDAVRQYRNALKQDLLTQGRSIKDKYIKVPLTTDFAIMYLPSESLYAEAMSIDGLSAKLRTDYSIVIGGPSIIAALLNSLQMGFRSLQIQKNSEEIRKAFAKFGKDFSKLNGLLENSKKKSQQVVDELGKAIDRNEKIGKTLDKYAIASSDDEEAAAAIEEKAGDDDEG